MGALCKWARQCAPPKGVLGLLPRWGVPNKTQTCPFQTVIAAVTTAVGAAIRLSTSLLPPSAFRRLCV
jgi:hypothetical protein